MRLVGRRVIFRRDGHRGARPFARIVEEVADDLLEVLLFALEFHFLRNVGGERQPLLLVDTVHRAYQPGDHRLDLGEGADDATLRKAIHKTIAGVTADIEGFTFNKAVARLHELANAVQKLQAGGMARREAFEALARLMAPMVPHFAEEVWARLGHATPLVETPWPDFDAALARDDVISLPVQVNGKKRAEIEVEREADRETIEGLVMASPDVARFLGGKQPKKVIVVPGRIVNVVL